MRRLTEIAQNSQTHTYVGLWHTYQGMSNDQIFIFMCTELIIYLSTYQYFHLYYETPLTIEKVSKGVSLLPYCAPYSSYLLTIFTWLYFNQKSWQSMCYGIYRGGATWIEWWMKWPIFSYPTLYYILHTTKHYRKYFTRS